MQSLEKKVDGLVSLLGRQPHNEIPLDRFRQTETSPTTPIISEIRRSYGSLGAAAAAATPSTSSSSQQTPNGATSEKGEASDVIDRGLVTLELAQQMLDRYRFTAIQYFPYVILNPDASLGSMRCQTPFLFLCVITAMMVDNCTLQRQLGEEVRLEIHRRVLLRNEKNLELLQGILVHLAWYHYQFLPQQQQVPLLTNLCVTIVQELGFDRNPKNTTRRSHMAFDGRSLDAPAPTPASTAQLRALLGTYCMASS